MKGAMHVKRSNYYGTTFKEGLCFKGYHQGTLLKMVNITGSILKRFVHEEIIIKALN